MKILVFGLILLMNLPALAQEDSPVRPEDLEQRVHVINNSQAPAQNPSDSQIDPNNPNQPVQVKSTDEDDKLIDNLEEDRRKSTETAVKLDQAKNQMTEAVFNAPEELRKLGVEQITGASLLDARVVGVMKKMLEQNSMKNASDTEVRAMILEKAKGTAMENFLITHPKVTNTFIEILKDPKAMPSIIGIFLRRDDLKVYGCIWLGLMIFAWLFKKFLFKKKKNWSSAQRMLVSFLVSICITITSFTIFYNMFHDEISPTAKIIVKHWRRRNLKS